MPNPYIFGNKRVLQLRRYSTVAVGFVSVPNPHPHPHPEAGLGRERPGKDGKVRKGSRATVAVAARRGSGCWVKNVTYYETRLIGIATRAGVDGDEFETEHVHESESESETTSNSKHITANHRTSIFNFQNPKPAKMNTVPNLKPENEKRKIKIKIKPDQISSALAETNDEPNAGDRPTRPAEQQSDKCARAVYLVPLRHCIGAAAGTIFDTRGIKPGFDASRCPHVKTTTTLEVSRAQRRNVDSDPYKAAS
ncbi:hypothetical protein JB92DRAFT_2827362 [Gautieria morchelliformis]|nr:hypothetical protein JB92DRAFT_2827362 [Gautieria morchelliformis]